MLWFVMLGMLAAFGAVCALWILIGAVMPHRVCCKIICFCKEQDAGFVRHKCRWLREMGWIHNPVVITWDLETATKELEKEWTERNAAGYGDPPGNHRCGGLSEL